jgi:hypothetical protein
MAIEGDLTFTVGPSALASHAKVEPPSRSRFVRWVRTPSFVSRHA